MRKWLIAYLLALVAASALFLFAPGIDLWVSALFYRPESGFFLAEWAPVRALYRAVPLLVTAQSVGIPLLLLWGWWRGRPPFGLTLKAGAFVLLVLAIGPGLLVNAVLKDHWGRARPSQVTEFGGTKEFTPAPLPAAQCDRNCSFVAGHPAAGFALLAYAFLATGWRRRWVAAGAIGFGALLGVVRIAQGGHFLSDVVFSGLLVGGTTWLLAWLILERDGFGAIWRGLAARLGRVGAIWALYALFTLAGVLVCYSLVDRPVALFFHRADPAEVEAFRFITRFGVSTYYLIGSALAAAALWLAARHASLRERAKHLRQWAAAALFLFLSIAVSGLATDLLKIVFGRARPKLFFANETFGFDWWGGKADFWSFPSGHATTAVAIGAALYCLWPRLLPLYVVFALLVSLSRLAIGAHYVSDVIFATFVAIGIVVLLRRGFERRGIHLPARAAEVSSS
ncbi:MAG TPA: phosphatase PAP2 family protein [Stellaceae bacterium]|nr:phosphatase PAP2 family protein [Stellaceae bacterium]